MSATRWVHLVRHGRSACEARPRLSREDYRLWVEAYDAAGIADRPPDPLRQWLRETDPGRVFSSTLSRSIQSAQALFPLAQIESVPVFDEAAIAIAPVPLRMSSSLWTLIGRMTWSCGAPAREHVTKAKDRALEAAELLAQASAEGDAVLIGHGWMNRMIGQAMRTRGFTRATAASGGYWSSATFQSR